MSILELKEKISNFMERTIGSEKAIPYLIFLAGCLVGYWSAPDNAYEDAVSHCIEVGKLTMEGCARGVAEIFIEAQYYHRE